ncbi:MAG: CsgG/HfaB family protein [Cetobacterium sp.]
MKILKLMMIALTITSCAPSTKYSNRDVTNNFEVYKQVSNQNRKIAIVNTKSNEELNDLVWVISESEFSESGFEVLERKDFSLILNEQAFSASIAIDQLQQLFPSANEVVQITITKNKKWDYLDFYLVYNRYVAIHEIRVDIKLINTQTGRIKSVYGEGKTEISTSTVMLVLGNWHSKADDTTEETLRIAIRDGINKIK